jgi:hypothetical protein
LQFNPEVHPNAILIPKKKNEKTEKGYTVLNAPLPKTSLNCLKHHKIEEHKKQKTQTQTREKPTKLLQKQESYANVSAGRIDFCEIGVGRFVLRRAFFRSAFSPNTIHHKTHTNRSLAIS